MADPLTGVGLAASLVTLLEVSYKIAKCTKELSERHGKLPPDLLACNDLISITRRTCERLKLRSERDQAGGPATAFQADLTDLIDQYNETQNEFSHIIQSLQASNTFLKAIKLIRREEGILRIRNALDRHTLAILFVLEEDNSAARVESRYVRL